MELKLKNIWIKFGRLIFFIPPAMLLYFLIREDLWNREVCYYAAIAIYGSLSVLNLIRVLLFYKREKQFGEIKNYYCVPAFAYPVLWMPYFHI